MKGNSMKYIAKKDTWFKEGTECKLIEDYRDYTLPGKVFLLLMKKSG
jgi:hypothetical protein